MSTDHSDWFRYVLFGLISPTRLRRVPRSQLWRLESSVTFRRAMHCTSCNRSVGVIDEPRAPAERHGAELLEDFYARARHLCTVMRSDMDANLRLLLGLTSAQLAALTPEAKRAVVTRWMEEHHL